LWGSPRVEKTDGVYGVENKELAVDREGGVEV